MRKLSLIIMLVFLTACSDSDGGGIVPPPADSCSNTAQKQFVLDFMRAWYLWNDLLPADVDINAFASPEELLAFLITVQPLDNFSFINTLVADQQFFGEGKFEGFGFGSRFVAADDLRLTRVFVDSPANRAVPPLARGQQILELNGRTIAAIEAAEGVGAVFDTSPLTFTMREPNNNEFTVSITQDIVTIDPVPQSRIIPVAGTPGVGYIEFAQFISTADPKLDAVFGQFVAAGITDLIIDMRFNGGGLVSTAELLGDFLGGAVAQNLVFSKTLFNADRGANNTQEFFELRLNSLGLSRLIIIASQGTASASELVTNSMEPYVDVTIVGDRTFGKPVGQVGVEFCEQVLRPTAFQTLNADDFGDYFGGLPADCVVADDLEIVVGADNDPNVEAALTYVETGSYPVACVPGVLSKSDVSAVALKIDRRGPPQREFADAH
jgi:C-terminal processing protease CtpA/Prc